MNLDFESGEKSRYLSCPTPLPTTSPGLTHARRSPTGSPIAKPSSRATRFSGASPVLTLAVVAPGHPQLEAAGAPSGEAVQSQPVREETACSTGGRSLAQRHGCSSLSVPLLNGTGKIHSPACSTFVWALASLLIAWGLPNLTTLLYSVSVISAGVVPFVACRFVPNSAQSC